MAPAASLVDIKESIQRHARYSLGREWQDLSPRERFTAVALSVRDRLIDGLLETQQRQRARDAKRLYYLSIEYLIGRSLANNLEGLQLREAYREALAELGPTSSS